MCVSVCVECVYGGMGGVWMCMGEVWMCVGCVGGVWMCGGVYIWYVWMECGWVWNDRETYNN